MNTGADGKAGAAVLLPPPAAAVAGALALPALAGGAAAGAGASAERFGLAAGSFASSSSGRFFGAVAASSRSGVADGAAGGSGVGKGRESWPALSRALQAAPGAKSRKPGRNQAHMRLSMGQAESQLGTRVKRVGCPRRLSYPRPNPVLLSRPDVPRPSQSARDKAKSLLEERLGPSKVLTAKDACERFVRDESEAEGEVPDAVVLATSSEDILAALAVAREAEVPITPRAGGTGRTGGAVPMAGGIVLATSGMNRILEIDRKDGVAVVEPGVVLADLHAAVEAEGWFYPPDPNSLKSCAIGGNVAENAGGPRAFKYGVTRDYVLGVEAFLLGGQRIQAGRRTIKGVTGYDVTGLWWAVKARWPCLDPPRCS